MPVLSPICFRKTADHDTSACGGVCEIIIPQINANMGNTTAVDFKKYKIAFLQFVFLDQNRLFQDFGRTAFDVDFIYFVVDVETKCRTIDA